MPALLLGRTQGQPPARLTTGNGCVATLGLGLIFLALVTRSTGRPTSCSGTGQEGQCRECCPRWPRRRRQGRSQGTRSLQRRPKTPPAAIGSKAQVRRWGQRADRIAGCRHQPQQRDLVRQSRTTDHRRAHGRDHPGRRHQQTRTLHRRTQPCPRGEPKPYLGQPEPRALIASRRAGDLALTQTREIDRC